MPTTSGLTLWWRWTGRLLANVSKDGHSAPWRMDVEMDRTPPGELICSNMRQNELFRDVIRPAVELVLNLLPFIMIILALSVVIKECLIS